MPDSLDSILVVYQNPALGRLAEYDDWYTNIHIRDALRLDGAIATQRFIVADEQPVIAGKVGRPEHWAHTIYEWESAAKSVQGHIDRAGTPEMEISRDCEFARLRDYFYRPEYLSHGWSREAGFRRGSEILTALIVPAGDSRAFVEWFEGEHAPSILAVPGFGSAALFSIHEAQSLPHPAEYPLVAVYGLTDSAAALSGWARHQEAGTQDSLGSRTQRLEIGAWQPRIPRLRAEEVAAPSSEAAAREQEARRRHAGNYLSRDEVFGALSAA